MSGYESADSRQYNLSAEEKAEAAKLQQACVNASETEVKKDRETDRAIFRRILEQAEQFNNEEQPDETETFLTEQREKSLSPRDRPVKSKTAQTNNSLGTPRRVDPPDMIYPDQPLNALEPVTIEGELARHARQEDEQESMEHAMRKLQLRNQGRLLNKTFLEEVDELRKLREEDYHGRQRAEIRVKILEDELQNTQKELVLWRDLAEQRLKDSADAISDAEIQRTEVSRLREHMIQITVERGEFRDRITESETKLEAATKELSRKRGDFDILVSDLEKCQAILLEQQEALKARETELENQKVSKAAVQDLLADLSVLSTSELVDYALKRKERVPGVVPPPIPQPGQKPKEITQNLLLDQLRNGN